MSDLRYSKHSIIIKRTFDFIVSTIFILLFWWLFILLWLLATIDTGQNGFFLQERVGIHRKTFRVIKVRTMRDNPAYKTDVTVLGDPRITKIGSYLRRYKLDEITQIINVFLGDMSFVGPRPDVPTVYENIDPSFYEIFLIRPGITGPASIKYSNEEELLAYVKDPEEYSKFIIFPDKLRINLDYLANWSFLRDLKLIINTLF